MKTFWRAALIRAFRTVCQNLASSIPAGIIVTPVMVEALDITVFYVLAGWLITGLLGGVCSLLTSVATGLPEVEE